MSPGGEASAGARGSREGWLAASRGARARARHGPVRAADQYSSSSSRILERVVVAISSSASKASSSTIPRGRGRYGCCRAGFALELGEVLEALGKRHDILQQRARRAAQRQVRYRRKGAKGERATRAVDPRERGEDPVGRGAARSRGSARMRSTERSGRGGAPAERSVAEDASPSTTRIAYIGRHVCTVDKRGLAAKKSRRRYFWTGSRVGKPRRAARGSCTARRRQARRRRQAAQSHRRPSSSPSPTRRAASARRRPR